MQKILSVRLEQDDLRFLKTEAKEEKIDKAKVLRDLVEKGRLQLAIEQYKQGKVSIGRAAEKAGITISEMMDRLAELGIPSKVTLEQHLQGLKNLESVFK